MKAIAGGLTQRSPVETTGIYRDLWERKPLGKDQLDQRLKRRDG